MAISRGAGTEIIRTVHLNDVDTSESTLIFGVAHHIYTVLSVVCYCASANTQGNYITMYMSNSYDSKAGTSGVDMYIFRQDMINDQTFVWNDKFSFNGAEPTDFTGPMDDATKQDAIADQAGANQELHIKSEHASDIFHVHCTFIDQNNA